MTTKKTFLLQLNTSDMKHLSVLSVFLHFKNTSDIKHI